jgi:hypothetical protein
MSNIIFLLLGVALGAAASLLTAVYVQDRWKETAERRSRLRRAKAIMRSRTEDGGPITIAGNQTTVYLVEGDGEMVFEPKNLTINLRSTQVGLPTIVAHAREKVKRNLAEAARRPGQTVAPWNSPSMIALHSYRMSRTAQREDASLLLETSINDYATFAATVLQLDANITKPEGSTGETATTLRREYFPSASSISENVRHPLPFLANGIGVMLLAFTDDNKALLGRRRQASRARPAERDVSVVEGMDANYDSDHPGKLNVYTTAVRGCQEELGITVSPDEVQVLAFGVDTKYYQWNFLGLVETRHSADEVLEFQMLHAKDRWEMKLEAVEIDPVSIFERLRQDKVWDLGLVTIYYALCRKCGVRPVQRAAEKVFGVPLSKAPWQR